MLFNIETISGLLFSVSLFNILLGLLVFYRKHSNPIHLLYAGFTISIGLWSLGLGWFEIVETASLAINIAKFYYVSALAIGILFYLFSKAYINDHTSFRRSDSLHFLFGLISTLLIVGTDWLVAGFDDSSGRNEIELGLLGYNFYSISFLAYFGGGFYRLWRSMDRGTDLKQLQLKYIFYSLMFAGIPGVLFNLILPYFGNYQLVWLGPLFSVVYATVMAFAILRHRMFDIKTVFARSFAYLAVLVIFIATFITIATTVLDNYLGFELSLSQQVFFVVFSMAFALLYQPVKSIFDRLTSRIFFRYSYDSRRVINELSDVLVSQIELKQITENSSRIIESGLSISSVGIYTLEVHGQVETPKGIRDLFKLIGGDKATTKYISDEIESTSQIKRLMNKNDLEIAIKLRANEEEVGLLYAGSKLSGAPYTDQDIDVLSIASSEIAIAIQNSQRFEQIREFNIKLQNRIKLATRDLERSNKKLKKLDEAKDEFIGMASHQLRTPLTAMKGYVSMVMDGDAGKVNNQQKELLGEAFASSQRMVYLIADLLNVSRLNTGKFVIEKTNVNLADMVESEIKQLKETANARNLTLEFHKPANFPEMDLDETKTRQVVMNFADNAIYYTPSGGKIDIQLKVNDKTIEYRVVDSGIGVKKEDQKNLFTKFFRASNAKKARPDGTGLGLYMAKKIIVAQGGSVIFESQEGKGSTFGFSMPRK